MLHQEPRNTKLINSFILAVVSNSGNKKARVGGMLLPFQDLCRAVRCARFFAKGVVIFHLLLQAVVAVNLSPGGNSLLRIV